MDESQKLKVEWTRMLYNADVRQMVKNNRFISDVLDDKKYDAVLIEDFKQALDKTTPCTNCKDFKNGCKKNAHLRRKCENFSSCENLECELLHSSLCVHGTKCSKLRCKFRHIGKYDSYDERFTRATKTVCHNTKCHQFDCIYIHIAKEVCPQKRKCATSGCKKWHPGDSTNINWADSVGMEDMED